MQAFLIGACFRIFMYGPAEDSFLLLKSVKASGNILEMCTGSGIIAGSLSKQGYLVTAAEIDKESIRYAQDNYPGPIYVNSDLFSNVTGLFDTIVCNPPYLPNDVIGGQLVEDRALYGGKHGYEFILRFLGQAVCHLQDDGSIFLLFSNLSKPSVILCYAESLMLSCEKVNEQFVGLGETLYVYRFWKSPVYFATNDLENIEYLAHGKHGVLWTGNFNQRKVVIKSQQGFANPSVQVVKEANMLLAVNKVDIGPSYVRHDDVHVVMNFIEGKAFHKVKHTTKLLRELMRQCFELDKLGITKEELRRPRSNIIVNEYVVMIDFERSHYDLKPRNVTQYAGFLIVHNYLPTQAISLLRQYSSKPIEVYKQLYNLIRGPDNNH